MGIRLAIIGLGGMGMNHARHAQRSRWCDLVGLCDRDADRLQRAGAEMPGARLYQDSDAVFADPDVDVVTLCTLADVRPQLIRQALASGKHIIAEKPLAATVPEEEVLLAEIEASDRIVAVNIFNRNAWYHEVAQDFIAAGEIGELAVVRVRHQTAGLLPGGGHGPEGPPFHDCGMHYVDVARWYAGAEYADWHAIGQRLWGHPVPWWVDVHGHFSNGVAFSITQGFIHGQLATVPVNSCGLEAIGTRGVVFYQHDFQDVRLHLHGQTRHECVVRPYGDKKIDVLIERTARAIAGEVVTLPSARDAVIASRVSQAMLDAATAGTTSMIGNDADLVAIRAKGAVAQRS